MSRWQEVSEEAGKNDDADVSVHWCPRSDSNRYLTVFEGGPRVGVDQGKLTTRSEIIMWDRDTNDVLVIALKPVSKKVTARTGVDQVIEKIFNRRNACGAIDAHAAPDGKP